MSLKSYKYKKEDLRTWVEIDKAAVKHNFALFRRFVGKSVKIMAVVKSNAYGHDLKGFARVADSSADWFGVDSITEAIALRRDGIKKPILVLGYTLASRYKEAIINDVSLTVSGFDSLRAIKASNIKGLKVHLKIDTGMNRQGFYLREMDELVDCLRSGGAKIVVEGVYTHFPAAKNPSFPQFTNGQIDKFNKVIETLERNGFKPRIRHAAATAGCLLFPSSHYDMVRIGIGSYGLWPSKEVERYMEKRLPLMPILSWKTIVAEVKRLPDESGVGYDLVERMEAGSKIAICPIGYWHGFRRSYSSVGNVLIRGKRARVVGRVSMDMIVVDVTGINGVASGDEVVLLGRQKNDEITADELAFYADTINYEVVTSINPLIRRFFK